jgi:hypothetical protein
MGARKLHNAMPVNASDTAVAAPVPVAATTSCGNINIPFQAYRTAQVLVFVLVLVLVLVLAPTLALVLDSIAVSI